MIQAAERPSRGELPDQFAGIVEGRIRAWVVTAEMGYGHRRAVHPLKDIAAEEILVVGRNAADSEGERALWSQMLGVYEFFSRARGIPLIGKPVFSVLDSLLRIPSLYPMRDLSRSTFQVDLLTSLIRQGLCRGMLERISREHLPLVTSFFAPAVAADAAGHDRVLCIVCDADLNRVWVAREPWESRIEYCAPCGRAAQRLKAYGVPEERIHLTGFPLDDSLLGGPSLSILKSDLGQRLHYLDPANRFWPLHRLSVEHFLGSEQCKFRKERKLTISYSVGGAGAQADIGVRIARSLKKRICEGSVRLNLIAGTRDDVKAEFERAVRTIAPDSPDLRVLHASAHDQYFRLFNETMRETDILWTKPSELSFYAGLGIPIIISPTIGSHEKFNRHWLTEIQAGVRQDNPDYTEQWLFDWLENGRFAEAAWDGFLKARKLGVHKIREVLLTGRMHRDSSPLLR